MNKSRPNSRPNLKFGRGRGREKLSPPAPGIHGAGSPGRLLSDTTWGWVVGRFQNWQLVAYYMWYHI